MTRRRSRRPAESERDALLGENLDPTADEVLRQVVQLMISCGQSPTAITGAVDRLCRAFSIQNAPFSGAIQQEWEDAPHLMTLWFSDPQYLNQDGMPKALPARGPAPSIEALLLTFESEIDAHTAIQFLIKVEGLRKEGELYVPTSRAISFRGKAGIPQTRNLRVLASLLRTLEHNGQLESAGHTLVEFFAVNPRFPLAQLHSFHERVLRPKAMAFLNQADSDMHRRELVRSEGEPTVRLGIGVYAFEEKEPAQRSSKLKRAPSIRRANYKRVLNKPQPEDPPVPSRLAAALAVRLNRGR